MNPCSTKGVSGLDAGSNEATAEGPNKEGPRKAATLQIPEPISPKQQPPKPQSKDEERDIIEELEDRVEDMEKQLTREEQEMEVPPGESS